MGAGLGDSTPASHSPGKRQHKTETRILLGGGKEKIIADGDLAFIANPKRGVGGRKCAPGCCPGAARGRIPGSWAPGDRRQPCSSRTSPGSPGARGSLIVADTRPSHSMSGAWGALGTLAGPGSHCGFSPLVHMSPSAPPGGWELVHAKRRAGAAKRGSSCAQGRADGRRLCLSGLPLAPDPS